MQTKQEDRRRKRKERKQQLKQKAKEHQDRRARDTLELLVDDHVKVEFKPDLDDPRFGKLYSDARFALDPTSSQFQKDKHGNSVVLKHQIKQRRPTQ